MSVSDISAATNGHNGTPPPIPTKLPPEANESRSGVPGGFQELTAKRRGTKPGSIRGPYHKGAKPTAAPEPAAPATNLFTPENVRPLVSLPFNLAFVKTGFEGFVLSDAEAATLSHTGTVALNQWVTIDPKYVALMLFSLSMITIAGQKMMLYSKELRDIERRSAQPITPKVEE